MKWRSCDSILRIRGQAIVAWTAVGIVLVLLVTVPVPARAQQPVFTVLHSFTGPPNDGSNPQTGLTLDSSGNLYGTTGIGGTVNCGTAFVVRPDGTEAVLNNFAQSGVNCPLPSGLTLGSDGNFYGTTAYGGAAGAGTVFSMTPVGTLTTLYSFGGSPNDGANPVAGVIRDAAGNLYGTNNRGGTSGTNCFGACGTVFKLSPDGTETILHSFTRGPSDGGNPSGGLIQDTAGNLYGTTQSGGTTSTGNGTGNGVVFKVAPDGTYTVLYSFLGAGPNGGPPNDGANPQSGLIQDSAGNLYGTTEIGGAYGVGTLFKLSPTGVETVLHSFGAPSTLEGAHPIAGAIMDTSGNLYGTTGGPGPSGGGPSVYEFSPDGTLTVLHSYAGSYGPPSQGALVQDAARNLYDTTFGGDFANPCSADQPGGCGVVFKLTTPSADLTISNTAPRVVPGGSAISYAIMVTNNGPDTALNVVITDVLPAGTTFNSVAISSGSCTAPAAGSTGTVTCTVPSSGLNSGDTIALTLVVNLTATAGPVITDTATVSSSLFDPTTADNSSTATTSVI